MSKTTRRVAESCINYKQQSDYRCEAKMKCLEVSRVASFMSQLVTKGADPGLFMEMDFLKISTNPHIQAIGSC